MTHEGIDTMTDRPIRLDDAGFIVKDDPTDLGVSMRPAPEGWTHQGPEDALDPNPTRGDYRARLGGTQHVTTEAHRTGRYDLAPTIRRVDQNAHAENIVDVGGPLDAADPDYDRKLAARRGEG